MAVVMHVQGLVRAVTPANKKSGERFGSRINVLTEPDGDTFQVLAFDRSLSGDEAADLAGTTVDLTVEVAAEVWNGNARLNATLVKVDSCEA